MKRVAFLLVLMTSCATPPSSPLLPTNASIVQSGPIVGCVDIPRVRDRAYPVGSVVVIRRDLTCPNGMSEVPQNEYYSYASEAENFRRIPTSLEVSAISPPTDYKVYVESTEFDRQVRFVGATTQVSGGRDSGSSFFLRSWMPRGGGLASHQIYFTDHYVKPNWRYYSRADDSSARPLEFTSIRRDVVACTTPPDCTFVETMGASVTEASLRQAARSGGYRVRFSGRGYDEVVEIVPEAINAQLLAISEYRRSTR